MIQITMLEEIKGSHGKHTESVLKNYIFEKNTENSIV